MLVSLAFVVVMPWVPAQYTGEDLDRGTQPLTLTTPLAANGSCKACHGGASDPSLPANTYRATMMDLAGVDPLFLASLEIAYNDVPAAAELCIRCHYPAGWLAGRGTGTPANFYGLNDDDKQGITCDYCHRMEVPPPTGVNPHPPYELSGVLPFNAQAFVSQSTVKQGPHGSPLTAGHASVYSPLMNDPVLCGQCHDVTNTFMERVDLDGVGLGHALPIERTYSEWRDSAYSDRASADYKTCQDCHMTRYDGTAATVGNPPVRELARHEMVGGNPVGPRLVGALYDDGAALPFLTGVAVDAERIALAAEQNLKEKTATLEARALVVDANGPRLVVRVTNTAGHKLPTGYAEGRRCFLRHRVAGADDVEVARGGDIDPTTFEFKDGEPSLRVYEILLGGGLEPGPNFHFVTVDRVFKDNRIPPKGFKEKPDTNIVDHSYPVQPDGTLAHWDDIEVPLDDVACWPAKVDVALEFQAVSGKYKDFLVANAPIFGPDLASAWTAIGGAPPVEMRRTTVAVYPNGTIVPWAGPYACEPGPVIPPGGDGDGDGDAGVDDDGPCPPNSTQTSPTTCACNTGYVTGADGASCVVDEGGDGDDGPTVTGGCACATPSTRGLAIAFPLALLVVAHRARRRRA